MSRRESIIQRLLDSGQLTTRHLVGLVEAAQSELGLDVDGLPGPKTRAAVERWMEAEEVPDQLTEHFHVREFASRDGTPIPDEVRPRLQELARHLEVIRARLGAPVTILSGWRSRAHNEAVGGAERSRHVEGDAADIRVEGVEPDRVADEVEAAIAEGKIPDGGLGRYRGHAHYDLGQPRRWDLR